MKKRTRSLIKLPLTVACVCIPAYISSAQWQSSGSNLYYDQGNVSVGTSYNAAGMFVDVSGDPLRCRVSGSTKLWLNSNGGLAVGAYTSAPSNGLYVSGNVGLGISSPAEKLHVSGNMLLENNYALKSKDSYGSIVELIKNGGTTTVVGNTSNPKMVLTASDVETGAIEFKVGPGGVPFKAMAGGFAMGVATPMAKLHANEGEKPTAIFDNVSTDSSTVKISSENVNAPTVLIENKSDFPGGVNWRKPIALKTWNGAIETDRPIINRGLVGGYGDDGEFDGATELEITTPTFYSATDSTFKITNGNSDTKYLAIGISHRTGNSAGYYSRSVDPGYILASYDRYNFVYDVIEQGNSFNVQIQPGEVLAITPVDKWLHQRKAHTTTELWIKVLH